ncbi:MAG: radical SAM protein [Candidatus Woesearchaeota archaeon]
MRKNDRLNVVFVEPRGNDANFFSKYMTLPLMGPIYLATILKKRGHRVKVLNEHLLGRDVNLKDLCADVLCLSMLTSTANRGYSIARMFKAQNPGGKVIIGGIHASMLPDEAAQFADHVVVGEGEPVITDIVEGKISDKIVRTQHTDLDAYPLPDFSTLVNNEKTSIKPVMTSRGCPFDCNFCAVTEMFGKKYRTLSIDNTMKTLKSLKPKKVFFYDDNFAAIKSRTYEMMRRIKNSGLDFKWSAQVRTDVANDPKLVEAMADAGCNRFYVGFESINPLTLKRFQKGQGTEQIKNSIKVFHENGIQVHGMFIFGSDDDDKNVFGRTSEFCNEHNIDSAQYATLVPLPGTQVFREFDQQGRLIHKMWDYYDGLHAVFRPKKMTALELQEGTIDAFKDFYSYTRAMNDAINIFVDYNTLAIKSLYSRVQMPSFATVGFKMMGARIVKDWMRQNKEYFEFLSALDDKKKAFQSFCNPQKTI